MVDCERLSEEHLPQVIALGAIMASESQFSMYRADLRKIALYVAGFVGHEDTFGFVALDGAEVVGFLFGAMESLHFANVSFASECGMFVKKSWRGSRAAFRLIDAFHQEARDRGARFTEMRLLFGDPPQREAVARMLGRRGYERRGLVLTREVA